MNSPRLVFCSGCKLPTLFRNLQKRSLTCRKRGLSKHATHYGPSSDFPYYNLTTPPSKICCWNIQGCCLPVSNTQLWQIALTMCNSWHTLQLVTCKAVLEMKIWITWSQSNLEFIINKNWKIYLSVQRFTGLEPENRYSSWGLVRLSVSGRRSGSL